jgi:hypothetical protein
MSLLQGILTKRSPANFREVIQAQNPALKTDQGFLIPGANINPKLNVTNIGAYKARPSDFVPSLTANYDNKIPEVKFLVDGQNVVQPQSNLATYALISKLGEQKFKAMDNAPYADYMRIKKLEREILESENTAGLSELQTGRELMRSLAEERRKQAEDDYLRKMLDSGLSMEDAQDEIETVRRNNALQEAKRVDDRAYQSKILLTRIAKSRGVASNINEPLSQSGAVMSPQPSDLMATLQGNKGEGFGNAPLDLSRQFLTPDYYKKFLRKTQLTQESADKMTAMNQLISSGQIEMPKDSEGKPISFASYGTPLQFDAEKRRTALENMKESIAQQMDSIKMIGQRHLMRLPGIIFAEKSMKEIYDKIKHSVGANVRSKTSSLDSLSLPQLLVLVNVFLTNQPSKIAVMKDFIRKRTSGKDVNVDKDLLKEAIQNFNGSQQYVTVPVFEGLGSFINQEQLNADAIQFLLTAPETLNGKAKKAYQIILEKASAKESALEPGPPEEKEPPRGKGVTGIGFLANLSKPEAQQMFTPFLVGKLEKALLETEQSAKKKALLRVMTSLRQQPKYVARKVGETMEDMLNKLEVGETMEDMLKKLESQPSNASASAPLAPAIEIIEPAPPAKKPLEQMNKKELELELVKRNISAYGNKPKLIQKLKDAGY